MAKLNTMLSKLAQRTGAATIYESRYGDVSNWISTGSLALNRILSGSIKKGIPSGRVVVLQGESSTGKSLLAALIMSNALKDGFDAIFYFDAEGGGSRDFFENVGCDTSKIYQILVSSVEDAQIKILDTYNTITEIKQENPEARFLCVLDSLGALVADKVIRDADKGKVASEMGGRAKVCNNMMKALTIPALQTDTAMIVLNHVYDDPSAMYTQKIKNAGGGKGLQYMGSIILQCTRNLEKDDSKDSDAYYGGTNLKFFTVKNRMARPSLECEVYLDFKKGFTRQLSALFDEAVRGGFITCPSQGYYCVPSSSEPEKKRRRSEIENDVNLWKTFLKEFDEWSQKDLQYSKLETINLDDDSVQENLDMLVSNELNSDANISE